MDNFAFDFKVINKRFLISNHKTGGAYLFDGWAKAKFTMFREDYLVCYQRGVFNPRSIQATQSLCTWCEENFGEEWERWHVKVTPGEQINFSVIRKIKQNQFDANLEVFIRDISDFQLFRLSW